MDQWRNESIKRDLSSFPFFGSVLGWIRSQIPGGWRAFYWEYPALLGQALWFGLFIVVNGTLMLQGADTTAFAPGMLFFAFDILSFNFVSEPYLLIFIVMAFLAGWIINKLVLIFFPKIRNSTNVALLSISLVSFLATLIIFGFVFSLMVGFLL